MLSSILMNLCSIPMGQNFVASPDGSKLVAITPTCVDVWDAAGNNKVGILVEHPYGTLCLLNAVSRGAV